jgi:serine protease Do
VKHKLVAVRSLGAILPPLLAIVLVAGGCVTTSTAASQSAITAAATANIALSGEPNFIQVVSKVRPAVVAITTEVPVRFFGRTFTQEGAGSGWVLDSSGLIVTNNHVVEGARTVTVTLEDGRNFKATSVKTDSVADLAVLKISASNLPALQISSEQLQVGQWVMAIGNALGLGISATKGIVSAMNVTMSPDQGETLTGLIQTDAAINPGNSGGPMVNLAGQVVGINSAKIAQVGVEGMGYAISIGEAMPIIQQLSR